MERRVFVSVNTDRSLDGRQRVIKHAVLDRLRSAGFAPQVFFEEGLARTRSWSIESVNEVMARCVGAVVLGFPRWRATTEAGTALLVGEYLHIEGAAALARGLPIFIAAEDGVEDRGIVYQGGGHVIAPISNSSPSDEVLASEFGVRLDDWIRSLTNLRDVFLGYCSGSDGVAARIGSLLTRAGATVHDWSVDFRPGGSILDQIKGASDICSAGVFVFSEDDPLVGQAGLAAPRDNVVFEAGYFMAAKGPERVLIVRVGNAKMPADLGGNIYLHLERPDLVAGLEAQLGRFVNERL